MRAHSNLRRAFDAVAVPVFALALCVPAIDRLVRPDEARSTTRENRAPAPRPVAPRSMAEVSRWPAELEAWFRDTLGLRDKLLRGRSKLLWRAFDRPPSALVYRATDGSLFFDADRMQLGARGLTPFTDAELDRWEHALRERARRMRARGVRYLFVLAPEKQSIYAHVAPPALAPVGPTRFDQLLARCGGEVEIVDLRPRLRAEAALDRGDDRAYFPFGTHWTSRGAWAAADELAALFARDWPAIRREPREGFELEPARPGFDDSIASALYLEEELRAPALRFAPRSARRAPDLGYLLGDGRDRVTEIDDPGLPRVLVLNDSFGQYVQPHLAEHCSRLVCTWVYAFSDALVARERPDVVIEMYAERTLTHEPSVDVAEAAPIDAAAHDARARLLWRLDPERPDLRASGDVEATRTAQDGAPALSLAAAHASHLVELPPLGLAAGSRASVRLVAVASVPFVLDVFHATDDERRLTRAHAVHVEISAGPNERIFELPADARDPVALRLDASDARLVVQRLEVRAD